MVLIFLSVIGLHNVRAQPTAQDIFKFKETFKYEVKYGFLKLGEIEVTMMPDTLFRGELHKHLITKITSNPKIPFIGTEIDHFNSLFTINDDGLPQTSYYWKDNIDEKISKDIEYDFDRINNFVAYKEEDLTKDTLELEEPATAGQVIFLFSRLFAGSGVDNSMIIYVTKKRDTYISIMVIPLKKEIIDHGKNPYMHISHRATLKILMDPLAFLANFVHGFWMMSYGYR